jgi:hypothetical protein
MSQMGLSIYVIDWSGDVKFLDQGMDSAPFSQHFSVLKWPQAKVMGVSLKTENEE